MTATLQAPSRAAYSPTIDGPPLAAAAVTSWMADVKKFLDAANVAGDSLAPVRGALAHFDVPGTTTTFGGHFKSGKSTLLNGLIGRPVLPVDDLPETGTLCAIRNGARDEATVYDTRGAGRPLEFSTDAIRKVVSLISADGANNTAVQNVGRLELVLAGGPLPAQARWLDSPGINDTAQMTKRAQAGADEADLLVWVLSSRQPLGETEVRFVAERVASHGPASVVFVLNAFLSEEGQVAWEAFEKRNLPVILSKVRDHAAAMGFSDKAPPTVLPVCGRSLSKSPRSGHGGAALHALLSAVASPAHPRVVRSRVGRAAAALRGVVARLNELVAEENQRLAKLRREHEQAVAAAASSRDAFRRDVESAFHSFQSTWGSAARKAGGDVADGIGDNAVARDGSYSTQLNGKLQSAASSAAGSLCSAIDSAARKHGQRQLGSSARSRVKSLLSPKTRSVYVPQNKPDYTAAQAVAAGGAALGFFTFGIAGLFGAAAAVPLAASADAEAIKKDASAARSDARNEGNLAATEFDGKLGDVVSAALSACCDGNTPPAPDGSKLKGLEALRDRAAALTAAGRRIATGE